MSNKVQSIINHVISSTPKPTEVTYFIDREDIIDWQSKIQSRDQFVRLGPEKNQVFSGEITVHYSSVKFTFKEKRT